MEFEKKLWVIIAIIAIGAGLFTGLHHLSKTKDNVPKSLQSESLPGNNSNSPAAQIKSHTALSNASTPTATVPNELASRAASPNAVPVPGSETNALLDLPPLTVLDKARVLIHNYRGALGEDPVGTNPEITAALKGKNPKQTDFLSDSGLRVNDKGELIDSYGTPFFFHQISGREMEIRSAGEDRKMWTADDLVTK